MCGIVGIVKLNVRETVDAARLTRMRDVLRHRRPDGEGLWIEGPRRLLRAVSSGMPMAAGS